MKHDLPRDVTDLFAPEDIVNMSAYVDDCRCACRSHFTVRDGLLNVHGRPIFDRLLIQGDLLLPRDQEICRLPDLLAVTGTINLEDCLNLKIMPSRMYAGGSILISRTLMRSLPPIMEAGRKIRMEGCPNVVELPSGIRTPGLHAAGCSKLTTIPEGLAFGSLNLSRTGVAKLPAPLKVSHELRLEHCLQLTEISEGVEVGTAFDVRGCDKLFTLPRTVQPAIALTDGMMLLHDRVIVPSMSAEEAAMCLGFKAVQALPHRHFKNLDWMQEAVVSMEQETRGACRGFAVALLETKRRPNLPDHFLSGWVSRLDGRDLSVLKPPAQLESLT